MSHVSPLRYASVFQDAKDRPNTFADDAPHKRTPPPVSAARIRRQQTTRSGKRPRTSQCTRTHPHVQAREHMYACADLRRDPHSTLLAPANLRADVLGDFWFVTTENAEASPGFLHSETMLLSDCPKLKLAKHKPWHNIMLSITYRHRGNNHDESHPAQSKHPCQDIKKTMPREKAGTQQF